MYILAAITLRGEPQEGLATLPTIRVRDLSDDSLVITDAEMSEVGDGWYKYNFTGYNAEVDYAIRIDAGATFPDADRYYYTSDFAKSPILTASKRIVNNKLEFYNANGVVMSFDLKDENGDPTDIDVFDAQ